MSKSTKTKRKSKKQSAVQEFYTEVRPVGVGLVIFIVLCLLFIFVYQNMAVYVNDYLLPSVHSLS